MCVVASANRPTWPLLIDWTPLLSPHTAGGFQTLKERAVQIRKTNAYSYLSSRINVSCLLLVCQGPRNLFSVLNVTDDIRDSAAAPVRPSSTASHARNCGRVRWCTVHHLVFISSLPDGRTVASSFRVCVLAREVARQTPLALRSRHPTSFGRRTPVSRFRVARVSIPAPRSS